MAEKACKPREVIPDLIEGIKKCLEIVDSIRARNSALYLSTHGPTETKEKTQLPEPPTDRGIQFLEFKVHQLLEELMDAEETYRKLILTVLGGEV